VCSRGVARIDAPVRTAALIAGARLNDGRVVAAGEDAVKVRGALRAVAGFGSGVRAWQGRGLVARVVDRHAAVVSESVLVRAASGEQKESKEHRAHGSIMHYFFGGGSGV